MKANPIHIDTGIQPGPSGVSFSPMYLMHKYWSKKPSEIIREYIKSYTAEGDIVLDPFGGYGTTAIEALRLGRRAIIIDLNPMSNFISRTVLEPVNLAHLQWAFQDIQEACQKRISELFVTKCPLCGDKGIIDFVVRDNDIPVQIAYTCKCSRKRLFKYPDDWDQEVDRKNLEMPIPYWYPANILLPPIHKERFKYFHELFTRRNLASLSIILHAIDSLSDENPRYREINFHIISRQMQPA